MADPGPITYPARLGVGPVERMKLAELGADTPEQLLAQIKAAPAAFARFLGRDIAALVEGRLRALVGPEQPTDPIPAPGPLGVPLSPPPRALAPPRIDLARRDAMYTRLAQLRASRAPDDANRAAENALDKMIEI